MNSVFAHELRSIKRKQIICRICIMAGLGMILFSGASLSPTNTAPSLSAKQENDFNNLIAIPDDAHVAEAAVRLFQRADIGSVEVTRGSNHEIPIRIELRKDRESSFSVSREEYGYTIAVGFMNYSTSGEDRHVSWGPLFWVLSFLGFAIAIFPLAVLDELRPAEARAREALAIADATDIKLFVTVQSGTGEFNLSSKCMSTKHLFFDTKDIRVELYERVSVTFWLPWRGKELIVPGLVRWIREEDNLLENAGFVIEFLHRTPEFIEKVDAELKRHKASAA